MLHLEWYALISEFRNEIFYTLLLAFLLTNCVF
jgi:chromodomain-helicase-DNA-binding protein 1